MRTFTAEYLRETRRGMWEDSRETLADLDLGSRRRVLDVGCGTGELTRVLESETSGEVIGVDVDRDLLSVAHDRGQRVLEGDAHRLPFPDDSFDLVVCQALLINLPEPAQVVREFARVSSDLVAAVEPDNEAVAVSSTVDVEQALAERARRAYVDGVDTDVTLGGVGTRELFRATGLTDISTRRYDHSKVVEPPYTESALESARRKATTAKLAENRETMLAGDLTAAEYDELQADWREMGRDIIEQMRSEEYRRAEVVPFYVTVGTV